MTDHESEAIFQQFAEPLAEVAIERMRAKHPEADTYKRGKSERLVRLEIRWLLEYLKANGPERLTAMLESERDAT